MMLSPLIFERSVPGRRGFAVDPSGEFKIEASVALPAEQLRQDLPLWPEVSEIDVVRHYTRLSQLNFSVDTHFYPLGSCTMKYSPKINESVASLPGFASMHPLQPASQTQGLLELLYELEHLLCAIAGMDAFTLQPAAGAQGELAGLKIMAAYHRRKRKRRRTILIPDSAHGTNPASACLSGFKVIQLRSGSDGLIDLNELRNNLSDDVAGLMLTNPNTLGLFEKEIRNICEILHERDALIYMDGANMNALLGIARPGDMDIDILQLNMHKTFSTPHGGGGPGSGPLGVVATLEDFLPQPRVRKRGKKFEWDERGRSSIGRVHGFYGNVGVLVRAFCYIRALGREGLERTSKAAIINANYLKSLLEVSFPVPFDTHCMHEFVLTLKGLKADGVTAANVAKRLLDYDFHAPTIYFPLIVEEAFMIEPTETESKETLEAFANAMLEIAREAKKNPELVQRSPQKLPVSRVDEVGAARNPNLRWSKPSELISTQ